MIYTKKKDAMTSEQRILEELSLAQFANPVRHPLLFLKESPLKEVMIPLEKGTFCESCENRLTSFDFTKKFYFNNYPYTINQFYELFISIFPNKYNEKRCKKCLQPFVIKNVDIVYQPHYKKQDMMFRKQQIHVQKLYYNRRAEQKYNHMRYYKYSK
jgi:hypothetical protein